MGVTDGVTNPHKQIEFFNHRQLLAFDKLVDVHPIDIFHHHIGLTIFSGTAIQHHRNVGMIEVGQDLSFFFEFGFCPSTATIHPDQFDSDLAGELLIIASTQKHPTHATMADFFFNEVGAYALKFELVL